MTESTVRRITWRTSDVARLLTLAFLFFLAWRFFWLVINAIFLGVVAILLGIMIHVPARYASRWIPFRVAFALSVLLFLGGIAGLLVALIPQVVDQIGQLARQLPSAIGSAAEWMDANLRSGGGETSDLPERINEQIGDFVGRFIPMAFNLITVVFASFAVVVLAIFLAAQPQVYRSLFLQVAPAATRPRWEAVYDEAGSKLQLWVIGKSLTMVAVGIATWIGLSLFGIPGALALAVLAAVLEFIPNFGPTIAAAPAIVAAFLISPATALYVAIFYFVLQQIQSAVTVPLVERPAVNIPAAALLMWQIMLAVGFGFLALFVATPLLAVIAVAVRILYIEPTHEREAWDRRDLATPGAPT
jgi:predicted PurR-regulated permease PerM